MPLSGDRHITVRLGLGEDGPSADTYVKLAHGSRFHSDLGDRDVLRHLEVARVCDLDGAACVLRRLHARKVKRVGQRGRALRTRGRLLVVCGDGCVKEAQSP